MELFTLLGKIAIDDGDSIGILDSIGEKAQSVQNKMAAFGENVQNVGSKISSVGTKLTLGVTTPLALIGKTAISATADFESSMSEVAAISGATGDDLAALEEKAKEMGKTTKFSASESAEALKYMAMAGWKTSDMLAGLEGIMNLAAASGEDLGATSDIVTDALTAFGLTASDSGHFADILATASSNANTNVSMMGETFKYVAPVAGALGYSAEDTAEAIGLMANAGIKSSQAGTSLRSILSNLQGEVKFAGAQFGEMTIQTTNADGSMRSLGEILGDCRVAFSMMSESERASNAEMVVGKEAMSGFLAIMNAAPSDIEKLNTAIKNCDGSAKSMADTMNNNLNGQITILKSQLEALAIQFVTLIMPYLKQGVEWLQRLCDWISGLDENTKRMILTVAGIAAALGPVLIVGGKIISGAGQIISGISGIIGVVGKLSPVIGSVISGGGKIVVGIGSLVGKIGTSLLPAIAAVPAPVWIVIGVITALIAIGVALYKNWDEIKEWASKAWGAIKDVIGNAIDGIKGFFQGIMDFIGNNWQGLLLLIVNPFVGGFKLLYDNCEAFRNFIDGFLNGLKEGFQNFKDNVSEKFHELKENVTAKVHEMKENVVAKVMELKDNAVTKITELKEGAVAKFHELKENASEKVHSMKEAVVSKVEEMKENASAKIREMSDKISSGFQDMKERAAEKFNDLKEKWTSKFTETKEKMISEATEMKDRVVEKLEEFKTRAVEKIDSLKNSAVQKFSEMRDNASAKISELSQRSIEGFNNIKEKGSAAFSSLKDLAVSKFHEMGEAAGSKFRSIADTIKDIFNGVKDRLASIIDSIKGFFDFEWKLPEIKLPHFSIDGNFSLNPPSIPHFGIEWYEKGGVMMDPTAFGVNPYSNNVMVGGEAGAEAIAPIETLKSYVREAVDGSNMQLYNLLNAILMLLREYLPELANMQLVTDTGALVGELGAPMYDEFGRIAHNRGRRN